MTCIKGFENYKIYEDGKIINKNGLVVKPYINELGYFNFTLCKNSKKKHFYLHRLLGLAFIPNPENKPEVDHIDRNPSNNNLENLHWVTSSENSQNTKMPNTNTTGHKYIYKDKNFNGWRFQKIINKKRYQKFSMNKQELLDYKAQFLLEHNLKD